MSKAYIELPTEDDNHRVTVELVKSKSGLATLRITTNADSGHLAPSRYGPMDMDLIDGGSFTVIIED